MAQPNFLLTSEQLIRERFPNILCGYIAGSFYSGKNRPGSDVDIWLVFKPEDIEPKRMSIRFNDMLFEVFLNTPTSLRNFLHYDRTLGRPPNCHAICHSAIMGPDQQLAEQLRKEAKAIMAMGPVPLNSHEIDNRRYSLTAVIKKLNTNGDHGILMAVLAELYPQLIDFYLRANRRWSGREKHLVHEFRKCNWLLSRKCEAAFAEAFRGKPQKLVPLIDEILAPFGGRYFDGYERTAIQLPLAGSGDDQAAA